MGKKRKANGTVKGEKPSKATKFDAEERFDDSEDEFYNARDTILLDDGPDTRRRKKLEEQEKDLELSDEEVLDLNSEDEDAESLKDDVVESEEENWGSNKADYYNADVIETEADALEEEAEARRLQQKQLKGMTEEDFGIDTTWTESSDLKQKRSRVEKLPELQIPIDATKKQRQQMLFSRYPETGMLAQDLIELQGAERGLRLAVEEQESKSHEYEYGPGIKARTKLRAVSTYLATITLYFGVLSSKAQLTGVDQTVTALNPAELHEHPIIEALATAKMNWDRVKGVPTAEMKKKVIEMVEVLKPDVPEEVRVVKEKISKPKIARPKEKTAAKPQKKSKYTKLQDLLQTATQDESDDELGDEDPLTQQEAEEKARKRKSLRFYTSQITQKANKRGAASRGAGGDDDVPHKERIRDRQERLLREAEARGKSEVNREEELDGESGDEYYQSLVTQSKDKKKDKKIKADVYAEAAKFGGRVFEEETVGEDGKRAINYAIEKNKGLTPKRSKDVRNPRVRKRKKYDEKMKKLGSMRQVYKGGEGRGGYGGELTGIKSNIVRGVRL